MGRHFEVRAAAMAATAKQKSGRMDGRNLGSLGSLLQNDALRSRGH